LSKGESCGSTGARRAIAVHERDSSIDHHSTKNSIEPNNSKKKKKVEQTKAPAHSNNEKPLTALEAILGGIRVERPRLKTWDIVMMVCVCESRDGVKTRMEKKKREREGKGKK
jgi:hypothetical protein